MPITTKDQLVFYVSSKNLSTDVFILNLTIEIDGTGRQNSTVFYISKKPSHVRPRLIQNNVTELVHPTKEGLSLNPTLFLNNPQVAAAFSRRALS